MENIAKAIVQFQSELKPVQESRVIWLLRRELGYKKTNRKITDATGYIFNNIAFGVSDCWTWTGNKNSDGYGIMPHSMDGKLSHRFVYEMYKGELSSKDVVMHTCDNPPCVNPNHLMKGTQAENISDMVAKKRQWRPVGSSNPKAKLDNEKVSEIRRLFNNGKEVKHIAKLYDVAISTIYRVVKGESWK